MRKAYLYSLDETTVKKIKDVAKELNIAESRIVEQCICKHLNINYEFLEKRGRKSINKNEVEEKMSFRFKVSKKIFTWIYKYNRKTDEDIQLMCKYLEQQKQEIITNDDKLWLDQMILTVQSRNFESMPIDQQAIKDKSLLNLLYSYGLKQEEINTIMKIVKGKLKPKISYAEKIEFEKCD